MSNKKRVGPGTELRNFYFFGTIESLPDPGRLITGGRTYERKEISCLFLVEEGMGVDINTYLNKVLFPSFSYPLLPVWVLLF